MLGDNILANKENAFLASVYFGRQTTGVAFLDISTGEFYVADGSDNYVDKLISNLAPKGSSTSAVTKTASPPLSGRHYTPARRMGLLGGGQP